MENHPFFGGVGKAVVFDFFGLKKTRKKRVFSVCFLTPLFCHFLDRFGSGFGSVHCPKMGHFAKKGGPKKGHFFAVFGPFLDPFLVKK